MTEAEREAVATDIENLAGDVRSGAITTICGVAFGNGSRPYHAFTRGDNETSFERPAVAGALLTKIAGDRLNISQKKE